MSQPEHIGRLVRLELERIRRQLASAAPRADAGDRRAE